MTSLRWYHDFEAKQLPSIKQAFDLEKINCSELRKLLVSQVEAISKYYTVEGRASPIVHFLEAIKISHNALTDFSANINTWMPFAAWPLTSTFQNLKSELKRAGDLLGNLDELPAVTCDAERALYSLALHYINHIINHSQKKNPEYDEYIIHLGISSYLDKMKDIYEAMKSAIKLYDFRLISKGVVANVGVFSKGIEERQETPVVLGLRPAIALS